MEAAVAGRLAATDNSKRRSGSRANFRKFMAGGK
jgi:hypothetical protein